MLIGFLALKDMSWTKGNLKNVSLPLFIRGCKVIEVDIQGRVEIPGNSPDETYLNMEIKDVRGRVSLVDWKIS